MILTMLKHGQTRSKSKTRLYRIWCNMRQRCNDPNATSYKYYGAKGIKVLWKSFEEFQRDMQEGYADHLTLGRKKNDQHYCKRNCRWETPAQQNRNYSKNIRMTLRGEIKCLSDWADLLRIQRGTLQKRLYMGWTHHKALTTPLKSRIRK